MSQKNTKSKKKAGSSDSRKAAQNYKSAPEKSGNGASQTKNVVLSTDPYPMDKMCSFCARVMLVLTVVIFPLLMDSTKYSAITKFKGTTFTWIFIFSMLSMLFSVFISSVTRETPVSKLTRSKLMQPPIWADIALLAYWVLMLFSCLGAQNRQDAFFGITPRNNGFLFQSMYVASYFVISRVLNVRRSDTMLFAVGGALLGIACTFHFYGVDLYGIAAVNGKSYGGPFWNSTTYRFLGPVGNVNLGSYILSAAAVIAAGLYINRVTAKFDKNGIMMLVCFALSFYAELNINTDAGVVALAVAAVLLPAILCRSMDQLERMAHIYGIAMLLLLFNRALVECHLRHERFGKTGIMLIIMTLFFAALSAALWYNRKNNIIRLSRTALTRLGCGLLAAAVIGGLLLCYIVSEPDPVTVGPAAGAIKVTERYDMIEKSDTMLHELGQMLRGNFNDKFGHNRLFTWKRTLRLVKVHPLLGIGPDNFKEFFARYYHDEAVEMFPSSNGGLDKAHNEFLDVLLDNGVLGLLAYLAFFGWLLYYAFRKTANKGIAPVFGIAVAAYMAHAFFGYQLPLQSPVMWMMIGMLAALIRAENIYPEGDRIID